VAAALFFAAGSPLQSDSSDGSPTAVRFEQARGVRFHYRRRAANGVRYAALPPPSHCKCCSVTESATVSGFVLDPAKRGQHRDPASLAGGSAEPFPVPPWPHGPGATR
jgi:hypothetical protein